MTNAQTFELPWLHVSAVLLLLLLLLHCPCSAACYLLILVLDAAMQVHVRPPAKPHVCPLKGRHNAADKSAHTSEHYKVAEDDMGKVCPLQQQQEQEQLHSVPGQRGRMTTLTMVFSVHKHDNPACCDEGQASLYHLLPDYAHAALR